VDDRQAALRKAEEHHQRLSVKHQRMLKSLELDEMKGEATAHEISQKKKELKQDMRVRAHAQQMGRRRSAAPARDWNELTLEYLCKRARFQLTESARA
jgi:hypothetical protein